MPFAKFFKSFIYICVGPSFDKSTITVQFSTYPGINKLFRTNSFIYMIALLKWSAFQFLYFEIFIKSTTTMGRKFLSLPDK